MFKSAKHRHSFYILALDLRWHSLYGCLSNGEEEEEEEERDWNYQAEIVNNFTLLLKENQGGKINRKGH